MCQLNNRRTAWAGVAPIRAVARPHLANPAWTLLEAARTGYPDVAWPRQYRFAKRQLERNLERERAAAQAPAMPAPDQPSRSMGA